MNTEEKIKILKEALELIIEFTEVVEIKGSYLESSRFDTIRRMAKEALKIASEAPPESTPNAPGRDFRIT